MAGKYKGLTPHNDAKMGEIAKTVLMPGDPLRAKFIAENFLDDIKCVNEVRGMLAFTGTYKGVPVSVMGHGMGNPSMGIYSYELFSSYDVENIIRVGSCAGARTEVKLLDVVIGERAYSDSIYAKNALEIEDDTLDASPELVKLAKNTADELNIHHYDGTIFSSDCFYRKTKINFAKWLSDEKDACAIEMEAFALYANAQATGKKGITILTCSDHSITKEVTTAYERQTKFTDMMKLALEMAVKLHN